jgi:hypothetical protein
VKAGRLVSQGGIKRSGFTWFTYKLASGCTILDYKKKTQMNANSANKRNKMHLSLSFVVH